MHADGDDGEDSTCTSLSPSIWNSLPAELLERLLACLPIASLFKFRAVCRSWNATPFWPLFRNLRARMMLPETWLIMLPNKQSGTTWSSHDCDSCLSFLFNLDLNKAVALPNTFLPLEPTSSGRVSYCATAGGLICYHYHMGFSAKYEKNPDANFLWVGNPFTKEWKCLPPMNGTFPLNFPLRGLAGMVVLGSTTNNNVHTPQPVHYKIIVRTQSRHRWGSGMMTEEYDSHANAWRVTTTCNVPLDHRMEQVLHCSGSLYFLTSQVRDGIYMYQVAKQNWSRILPPKRYQFTSSHMVECCGHLVLVSGVGKRHMIKRNGVRRLHARTTGIGLWLLMEKDPSCANGLSTTALTANNVPTMSTSSWCLLSRMPAELVQEFGVGVRFHCTSIGNLIYFTNSISMLIFNVVARKWRRVIISKLPFLVEDFVSFAPKLEAAP